MKKFLKILGTILLALVLVGFPIFFGATPFGRTMWKHWTDSVQGSSDVSYYVELGQDNAI